MNKMLIKTLEDERSSGASSEKSLNDRILNILFILVTLSKNTINEWSDVVWFKYCTPDIYEHKQKITSDYCLGSVDSLKKWFWLYMQGLEDNFFSEIWSSSLLNIINN